MAKCLICGKGISNGKVVALSNGLECPNCHSYLEATSGSRVLPTLVALIAAFLVWELTKDASGPLGFVLPEVYSILTFGAVAPLFMMLTARLEPAPEPSAAAPAAHGHH